MNKQTKIAITVVAFAALCVMAYLYFIKRKLENKNTKLTDENLKLMLSKIDDKVTFDEQVFRTMSDMVESFRQTNPKIANEIVQSMELLSIGQIENAIEDLAKIIENILKEFYSSNDLFKQWIGKKPKTFHNYLEYCYTEDKKITEIEFSFFKAIKAVRNAEDHELDLKVPMLLNVSGLLSAINGIIKLSSFAYPPTDTYQVNHELTS